MIALASAGGGLASLREWWSSGRLDHLALLIVLELAIAILEDFETASCTIRSSGERPPVSMPMREEVRFEGAGFRYPRSIRKNEKRSSR